MLDTSVSERDGVARARIEQPSERFAVTILDYRGARLGALRDSKRGIVTIVDRRPVA